MLLGRFTEVVGGTDQATALHSSAGQEAEHGISPVVTTWRSLAERRTAVAAVERIVAQRVHSAVQAALDDRMVALREELGPLENQAASTNAVLRGSARQAAALSERLTQVERKSMLNLRD